MCRRVVLGQHTSPCEDEPEYTLDMLISVNPKYEGAVKECCPEARVPARGLEGAYSEDEPEYTLEANDR